MTSIEILQKKAAQNRRTIIEMIYQAKAGHPGGSLSIIDMLTAIYETDMDFTSNKRSRVVLSKGHAVPAQYAILYDHGFIRKEELATFRCINSRLQGHPHIVDIPETDATTGLLGQGLSIGVGMALAKKQSGDSSRVYVIVGDGEMHEGQIWESALQAPHYKLDNLILIVDYNKLSSSGPVNDVINLDPLKTKLDAFNWHTIEVDGHHMESVSAALKAAQEVQEKPVAIIAHTIKGKGISYMENNPKWHSSALTDEEYTLALQEITQRLEGLA